MKKITFLLCLALLVAAGCTTKQNGNVSLGPEEAKSKALDFINNNLMQPGQTVAIDSLLEEGGLYKFNVIMSTGQTVEAYMTKDGKKFFPQVLDIEKTENENKEKQSQQPTGGTAAIADVPKAKQAKVELFVMSHCPYGTQIEKGIIPALEALGEKVDFELKFCDYAMHGKTEVDEQINQYCIQKNEPKKLLAYLKCFLGDGDGATCLQTAKIDQGQLKICVADTDQAYKITELFNDQSTWTNGRYPQFNIFKDDVVRYGVSGSPGLVINEKKIASGRDSETLLKTICAAYENPPAECSQSLSSAAPSPGFGYGTTGSDTGADCGS